MFAEGERRHQVHAEPEGELDEALSPVQDQSDAVLVAVGGLEGTPDHQDRRLALGNSGNERGTTYIIRFFLTTVRPDS